MQKAFFNREVSKYCVGWGLKLYSLTPSPLPPKNSNYMIYPSMGYGSIRGYLFLSFNGKT